MKRGTPIILLALLILAVLAILGGCAPGKQAVRNANPPGVTVHLPMVESPKVTLHAEEPRRPPPGPQSVGDEYFGRWLTLIEVEINPVETERPTGPEPAEYR